MGVYSPKVLRRLSKSLSRIFLLLVNIIMCLCITFCTKASDFVKNPKL